LNRVHICRLQQYRSMAYRARFKGLILRVGLIGGGWGERGKEKESGREKGE
jgi:hypothetical protein